MDPRRSYQYPLSPPLEPPFIARPPTPVFAQSMPSSAEQILHYNNLIGENQQLFQDNRVLLMKLEKYEKLQPYINTIITKNLELEKQLDQLTTQNVYLGKNIKELHVDNKNRQNVYESRIKELNEMIQAGKDNGNRVRAQNQNLNNRIKVHLAEIEQYKGKLEEALMDKVRQEEINKGISSERDRLVGELKQLENYNKDIARNAKNKEDQLMDRLEGKEKNIKNLEKDIQELQASLQKKQEQNVRLQSQLKQMENVYQKLSQNHEALLSDHKSVSLKKAELEQLYEESLEKIGRREEQLSQLQTFREEEREIYRQEFNKINAIFQMEKEQYEQALRHKSLKNQKLTEAYNELMQRIEYIQSQIWELEKEIENKIKENKQKQYELEAREKHIRKLEFQIEQLGQKGLSLAEKLSCFQEENYRLQDTLLMLEKKYQAREDQFQQFVKDMRTRHEGEKAKWDHLFQDEKNKLKMTHQYEKRQVESMMNKKILLLEAEVEDYRLRLSRAEQERIGRAERDIIESKALTIQNRLAQIAMEKSFERRSIDKKDRDKLMSQFNPASGSKTARYPGIK